MFHGTSSKFKNRILAEGLIPDAKKTWDVGHQKSLGGVYLTSNVEYALRMGQYTTEKCGGIPLLVLVDVEPRSCFADEDDLSRLLLWAMKSAELKDDILNSFIDFVKSFNEISIHPKCESRIREIASEAVDLVRSNKPMEACYDQLSRSMGCIVRKDNQYRSVRTLLPIKLNRGRNRIQSMIEVNDGTLQVVYGEESIPKTFFFQWRKKMVDFRFYGM